MDFGEGGESHPPPTIGVTCNCGHIATVPVSYIIKRIPAHTPVKDLHYSLRCRKCDRRGRYEIDVAAVLGYERR